VEEADQVEEVQEEVSHHHKVRGLEADTQGEADHQVAEEEEDQDAEHQEEEEVGDSRQWEWKGNHILSQGPISSLSILCRQLRECGLRSRLGDMSADSTGLDDLGTHDQPHLNDSRNLADANTMRNDDPDTVDLLNARQGVAVRHGLKASQNQKV